MKVLIVDDSKAIIGMVGQMLEEGGHSYVSALNGLEAYEKCVEDKGIELVLLDWNMPVMNGMEFLKKNEEEGFTEASIMMMTTNNKPEHIREALAHGAAEYIMKPFTSDILFNKMELIF